GVVPACTNAAIGSASVPGEGSRAPDLLEAVDEAALKLLSQALKPINTLVYGVQDLSRPSDLRLQRSKGSKSSSSSSGSGSPSLKSRVRALRFAELAAVQVTEDSGLINLEEGDGNDVALPLFAAPLDQVCREALVAGFRAILLHPERTACWTQLSQALRDHLRQQRRQPPLHPAPVVASSLGSGERRLEVLEVERRIPGTSDWKTPFLPTDGDLPWRWVDDRGRKHPHLDPGFACSFSASRVPPCRPESLFRSTSEWCVDVSPSTDSDGWCYGFAWNSSTWEPNPSLFNGLRRRRWIRTFT
ncbi:unnamed protein product, partial [Polarella glacialis]